jgi:hypothetical protein
MSYERGVTVNGEAHLSLTEASKPAKITIVTAGPNTVAFETHVVGDGSSPTIYMDRDKARIIAEYILKITSE